MAMPNQKKSAILGTTFDSQIQLQHQ